MLVACRRSLHGLPLQALLRWHTSQDTAGAEGVRSAQCSIMPWMVHPSKGCGRARSVWLKVPTTCQRLSAQPQGG